MEPQTDQKIPIPPELIRAERQERNKRKASDVFAVGVLSDSDSDPDSAVHCVRQSFPFNQGLRAPRSNPALPFAAEPPAGPAMMVNGGYEGQMALLHDRCDDEAVGDIDTAPIFTEAVRQHAIALNNEKGFARGPFPFRQFGLLAGDVTGSGAEKADPRIFYNVGAPSSIFICGSQGSGKSHTLSCLLENCLLRSNANVLSKPLTGIVFHYDTFVSDSGGSPCEAAFLSSNRNVEVRVLCAPTNIVKIRELYRHLPNVKVSELRLNESDLNTKRMMDLMAVNTTGSDGSRLYIQIINKVLRDMRLDEQHNGGGFNYSLFKSKMDEEMLTKDQLGPLKQRLDVLESFMNQDHAKAYTMTSMNRFGKKRKGNQQGQHNEQGPGKGRGKKKNQIRDNAGNLGGQVPAQQMNTHGPPNPFGAAPPSQISFGSSNMPVANIFGHASGGDGRGQATHGPALPQVAAYGRGMATGTQVGFGASSFQTPLQPAPQAVPRFKKESIWTPKPGRLTIVDLSCPMVPSDMACSLFNMCLSLFLEQGSGVGRVIALDEAHKYMGAGQESKALTESLQTAIRVQRHIGARVIISTQEPTISPCLLDLCSVSIVHRFSSPEWLGVLREHLAGASTWLSKSGGDGDDQAENDPFEGNDQGHVSTITDVSYVGVKTIASHGQGSLLASLFRKIVALRTGEALLFSPSAAIGVRTITEGHEENENGAAAVEGVEMDDPGATGVQPDEAKADGAGTNGVEAKDADVNDAGASDPEERKEIVRLGHEVLKIRVRKRVTQDGGQSIMAT